MQEIFSIINATPDSFFSGSRKVSDGEIAEAAVRAVSDGATVLDVGGFSTRPGYTDVPQDEEFRRLDGAIEVIRREVGENFPVSIDTFRSEVVRMIYDKYGEVIVNDIEGGVRDCGMYRVVGERKLRYVMMAMEATMTGTIEFFKRQLPIAQGFGVEEIDLDPGFGFGKTLEENFEVFGAMKDIKSAFPQNKLFVGISRKSMIFKTLETTPQESLFGTVALGFGALERGADILRVHDTKAAADSIKLFNALQ